MSNIKISQLPLATSPLDSAVEMPVVQGGVTKRAPVNTIGFVQTGTGAVVRPMQDKVREARRSPSDFGNLSEAVAASNTDGVFIPEGEIATTTSIQAPVSQALVLSGRGADSLFRKQAGASAGPVYFFDGRTQLDLENIGAVFDVDTTATNGVNLFRWNHDDIVLEGVDADGAVTIDPVTGARNYLASFSTPENGGLANGLRFAFSKFRRFFWGFLKANTTVSTEKDISILFNEFDEFGSVALLFNSPATGSLIENVQIIGNKLGSNLSQQPFGSSVGFPHRGSFAGHVEYARLIANHATGYGGELFRAEESARGIIMALNTARLDGKDGIEIIPNNIAGTVETPRLFNVSDNILDHRGLVSAPTKAWGIGLQTYTSISGHQNAECIHDSVVRGNIVQGFAEGLRTHYGMQRNLVHHNVLTENDTGIITFGPSLGVKDNLIVASTNAVDFQEGGILGTIHIRSNDLDGGFQDILVDATSAPGAVDEWTWESGRFSIPNGSTFVDIIPKGLRIDGIITAMLSRDNVTYSVERGRIVFDGTTLTYYRNMRVAAGSPIISDAAPFGFTSADDRLAIQIFSSSGVAVTNNRLQVKFEGIHVWS